MKNSITVTKHRDVTSLSENLNQGETDRQSTRIDVEAVGYLERDREKRKMGGDNTSWRQGGNPYIHKFFEKTDHGR